MLSTRTILEEFTVWANDVKREGKRIPKLIWCCLQDTISLIITSMAVIKMVRRLSHSTLLSIDPSIHLIYYSSHIKSPPLLYSLYSDFYIMIDMVCVRSIFHSECPFARLNASPLTISSSECVTARHQSYTVGNGLFWLVIWIVDTYYRWWLNLKKNYNCGSAFLELIPFGKVENWKGFIYLLICAFVVK